MKPHRIAIGILAIVALAAYLLFIYRKMNRRPNEDTTPAPAGESLFLLSVADNWKDRTFKISSPFGTETVNGQPYNGQTVINTNSEFQLVRNATLQSMEITLLHTEPTSNIYAEQLMFDYETKAAYYTKLTRQQFEDLQS